MKQIKLTTSFLLLCVLFLFSCDKNTESSEFTDLTVFTLKDASGEVYKSLSPDLLRAIHDDLLEKGRSDDAEKLIESYDFSTGCLKGHTIEPSNSPQATDSLNMIEGDTIPPITTKVSQYEPHNIFAYAHVAGNGDIGAFTQAYYQGTNQPFPYVGTTGQKKRLEGFTLQTSTSLLYSRPNIYYALINPNGSQTPTGTWGEFVGTRAQHKTTIGLKIWSTNPSYRIWYIAHNEGTGWNQPWQHDGAMAGVWGKRLEAFAFYIMKY